MVESKSPLHNSALRLRDLTPGRQIIIVNIYGNRAVEEYTVLERPRVVTTCSLELPCLKVRLRNDRGIVAGLDLRYIGVIPSQVGWNWETYTLDARKRHLIVPPLPDPYPFDDDTFEDTYDFIFWDGASNDAYSTSEVS